MDLLNAFRLLKRRWLLVIVSVLIGASGGLMYFALATREYSSSITFYVSAAPTGPDSASSAYQGSLLSEQRVKSYTELITGPRVTNDVVRRSGLGGSPDELASKIDVSSPLDTTLLNVKVRDESAQVAANIANNLGTSFQELVAELEQSDIPGRAPTVNIRVVEPAAVNPSPVAPQAATDLALGLLLGMAVGVAGALLSEKLDQTIRDRVSLALESSAPVLGEVPLVKGNDHGEQVLPAMIGTAFGESVRQIRTGIQFVDIDSARKIVLVTGSLEAEGKSTVACSLAAALAEAGASVVLIETDLRRPSLSGRLNLEPSVGLTTALSGRCTIDEATQRWGNVRVVTSGQIPPNPSELLGSSMMASTLDYLAGRFEYVILDSPPLLPVTDSAVLAGQSNTVLLVCRYGKTSRQQVREAVARLDAIGASPSASILSMVPSSGTSYGYSWEYNATGRPPANADEHPQKSVGAVPRDARAVNSNSSDAITGQIDSRRRPQPSAAKLKEQ